MNIRPNIPIKVKYRKPLAEVQAYQSVRFRGENERPKMPEFLKPYKENERLYVEKNKMSLVKKAALTLGAVGAIVGITVTSHVFMPLVLAGVATFAGVFIVIMALFNKVDKNIDLPPGVRPMTPEQAAEDIKYSEALKRYERKQRIQKVKNFFGLT